MESRALRAAVGQPLVVATLGDSLTDEYSFYGPQSLPGLGNVGSLVSLPAGIATIGRSAARNWVFDLAALRASQVTFGAYSTTTRGETRNQGFAEDWARSGATASGSNLDGSATTFAQQYRGIPSRGLPGLLTQQASSSGFSPKNVNVVTLMIGSNDYLRAATDYAESLSQDNEFASQRGHVNQVNAGIERSIRAALVAVHHKIPRARIVVVTPPDITLAPVIDSALAAGSTLFPGLGQTITGSVGALNRDLTRLARQQHVGLVNTQLLFNRFRADPTIDGIHINLQASGQNLNDGFIGDGFHPGTIVQGLIAQAIVGQINAQSGKRVITPLTDHDIVTYAAMTQPAVTLSSMIQADPAGNTLVLRANVYAGLNGFTAPTGTVTFETLTAATATTPAAPGVVLGTAPVDRFGLATLTINVGSSALAPIYAAYSGDETTDARISSAAVPVAAGGTA